MFETNHQTAEIISVNLRNELHGEEKVGAVDIGIRITAPNTMLELFDLKLLRTFYTDAASGQGELIDHLPDLRLPMLAMPVKWEYVGMGYDAHYDYGMNGDRHLRFIDCQVDKFKFDMKAGGSVEFSFRIIAHPKPEQVGELYELNGSEIELTLMAPSDVDRDDQDELQSDLLDDAGGGGAPQTDSAGGASELNAELYQAAVDFVQRAGKASISGIQKEFKVGYNLAARLMDRMEKEGVVSELLPGGKRKVLEPA